MTIMKDVQAPVWYLEGMAEHFGAHQIRPDGTTEFRIIPDSRENSLGFGRTTLIRREYASERARTMSMILEFRPDEFTTPVYYAWSWALCAFLDKTPRYKERFREMGSFTHGNVFGGEFYKRFNPDDRDLATEWTLFVANVDYGYDFEQAEIEFQAGKPLDKNEKTKEIVADRGWQSSGALLEAGHHYTVKATGRFTLANDPKPWISEPQGITFRYFGGQPLGTLLGCLKSETGPYGGSDEPMLNTIAIREGRTFVAPVTGTLYLRVNDAWDSLADNKGHVDVTIRESE
jgi:hypothetical protein